MVSEEVLFFPKGVDSFSRVNSADYLDVVDDVLSYFYSFAIPSSNLNDGVGYGIAGASIDDDSCWGAYSLLDSVDSEDSDSDSLVLDVCLLVLTVSSFLEVDLT